MQETSKATPVRLRHVALGSLWMALLAAGGILQTHLRFSERDLEIQSRNIQKDLRELHDQRLGLEAKVEALRSGEGIRNRAMESLGLIAPSPTGVHRLGIEEELWTKYRGAESGNGAGRASVGGMESGEPAWKQWIDATLSINDYKNQEVARRHE